MGINIIFLVGLPGSGKTTFALKLKTFLSHEGCVIISKDTYRISQEGFYSFDPRTEEIVKRKFLTDLVMVANSPANKYLIIDNTNITASDVLDILGTVDNIEKNIFFIVFKKNKDLKYHIVRSVHSNGFDMAKMEQLNSNYNKFVPTIPNYMRKDFDGFHEINNYDMVVQDLANEILESNRCCWGYDYVAGGFFRGFPSFLRDEAKKRVYPACVKENFIQEPPVWYPLLPQLYENRDFDNEEETIESVSLNINKLLKEEDN